MAGILISIIASFAALSAVASVVRHGQVLVELGVRVALTGAVLLLPAAPLVLLVGFATIGAIPAIVLAAVCCLPSLLIARRVIRVLERQGTDRFDEAIAAMSRLMGGAIVMLSYVAIGGIFAITWQHYPG